MPRSRLPIEPFVADVCADVARGRHVVLRAPPGTGKTTVVPWALAGLLGIRRVVVVEPRRVAARLAAAAVAARARQRVGGRVGYHVRFDRRVSPDTRLLFVTDGMLLARLAAEPDLSGVDVLVFDEFHERRSFSDTAFALATALTRSRRPDLRLVVFSATFDPHRVAEHIGAVVYDVAAPAHPLELRYRPPRRDEGAVRALSRAVRDLAAERPERSILAFLPGTGEIRAAADRLRSWARGAGFELRQLHGGMPLRAQAAAVAAGDHPFVVLATNVAESSVTVEGVGAVVDTGLERSASYDPALDADIVRLGPAPRASCDQRAGRAARLGPGVAVRLFSAADYGRRPAASPPEVLRRDPVSLVLRLACAGWPDPLELPWLDPPAAEGVARARRTLARIGALDGAGRPTDEGRVLASLPLALPLARLVVEGRRLGVGRLSAEVAAYLSEYDGRPMAPRRGRTQVDVLADLAAVAEPDGPPAFRSVHRRVRRAAAAMTPPGVQDTAADPETALARAALRAMPLQVAASRAGRGELTLATSAPAVLAEDSLAAGSSFLVALAAEHRRTAGRDRVLVRSAIPVTADLVLEELSELCTERRRVRWDLRRGRCEVESEVRLGALVIETARLPATSEEADEARARALAEVDLLSLPLGEALVRLRHRVRAAGLPADLSDAAVRAALAASPWAGTAADPVLGDETTLASVLLGDGAARLDEAAPRALRLSNGVFVGVTYDDGQGPKIEAPIPWFFGCRRVPAVAGAAPRLCLLAPNRRAVQVTTDLAGFWTRHYPQIARQLRRRYPKHPFPDDPEAAAPPPRAPRRPPRRT